MIAGEVFITTDMIAARDRNDFWRGVTGLVFDTTANTDKNAHVLEGRIHSRPLGALLVGETTFNAQRYDRNRRLILQTDLDFYMIQVLTSGGMTADFNGTDVNAAPGDIFVQDMAQPLSSEVDAGSRFSVVIPRRELEKATGYRNLHGAHLRGDWPVTQLITHYLAQLVSLEEPLATAQAFAAQEALIVLLAGALNGEALAHVAAPAPAGATLRQRVLTFIEQNLGSGELTPDVIQRRFNVSRAHLYRAFAADGGVARVVQDKRLDAAFLELLRAGPSSRSIADIAYSMGFSSSNQLLRNFRARFGITPSEARHEGTRTHPGKLHTSDFQTHLQEFASAPSEHPGPAR